MMDFNIVKSEQELQDYIKSIKDIWGVRRGAAIRNTIMAENRLFNYPVFAAIQPSVDHHRSFHLITIICARRTAKRLVYWKTSKKRLSNKPLYRQPSMFYVMENEESLMEYFSKVDEDFYKWMNTFADRAEDCEIMVDDQAFHSAREEVVKLMKISKHPFMINSFKVGIRDNDRENRIKYFLKHFVIQLKDAKRLVYWKKDHYPSKTGKKRSFERPSYFIAAKKLPTPRPGRPRSRSYDGGEWVFGWNRPERPEQSEEDRPERENGLAETTPRGTIQPVSTDYEVYSDHRAPTSRTFYANTTVPVDGRNIAIGHLAGSPVEVRRMDDVEAQGTRADGEEAVSDQVGGERPRIPLTNEADGETEEVQVEETEEVQVDGVGEEVRRGDWVREEAINRAVEVSKRAAIAAMTERMTDQYRDGTLEEDENDEDGEEA